MCVHASPTETCGQCDGRHAHGWDLYDAGSGVYSCTCGAERCRKFMRRRGSDDDWTPCGLRAGHNEPHDFAGVWVSQ